MAIALANSLFVSNSYIQKTIDIAYTVGAGSNRALLVGIQLNSAAITSVTYAGAAMTLLISGAAANTWPYSIYWIAAPTVGTANIELIVTQFYQIANVSAISLTGASQTLPAITGSASTASSTTHAESLASITANNWAFALGSNSDGSTITGTSGTTAISASAVASMGLYAGPFAAAGTCTANMSAGSPANWASLMVLIPPAVSAFAPVSMPLVGCQ